MNAPQNPDTGAGQNVATNTLDMHANDSTDVEIIGGRDMVTAARDVSVAHASATLAAEGEVAVVVAATAGSDGAVTAIRRESGASSAGASPAVAAGISERYSLSGISGDARVDVENERHVEEAGMVLSVETGRRAQGLLDFPDEILLYIFSYLDLPDLALLARLSPILAPLTADPVLHLERLRIVSPSRVSHGLFARGPQGQPLRPSVGDLVQRGVLRGLGIERAWRMGGYWGSARSVIQYENGRSLARRLACNILATQLRRHALQKPPVTSNPAPASQPLRGRAGVEGSSPHIARALLPTMRKLKWCLQRDRLARAFKESGVSYGSVGAWLATPAGAERGWRVLVRERDEEKLRLAVCPGIRKARSVFEALSATKAL